MGGQGLASLLSGILGGVGNQIQLDKARKLQMQVADLQAERQAFESVMRDANATPQAKAAALRGILASTQQQPSGKGAKGKQQQPDMLSQITQGIIGMPSEPFVDPEQRRVQQEKDIEKIKFEEFQKEQQYQQQQKKIQDQDDYERRVKWADENHLVGRDRAEWVLTGKMDHLSSSFKTQARGISGNSITDQKSDAFGKPIDPKGTYDRVETSDGLVYMPGKATAQTASLLGLIQKANEGDPKAAQAVQSYEAIQTRIREGFAAGRAKYQLVNVIDQSGKNKTLPLLEASKRINDGEPLTMVTTAPFSDATNVQIVASESYPAIQGVQDYVSAFDNPKDRVIFAKLFTGSPDSTAGNLLNQQLREGLSPDGKKLAIKLGRLLETMGRVRKQMSLPQTDQAQSLSVSLVPLGQTPSSEYATEQLDQIRGMIDNALAIPAYSGLRPQTPDTSNTPPPGAKILKYNRQTGKLE